MSNLKRPPHEVLGLAAGASSSEIKRKYKKLIRQFPPESHPEHFMAIREAYDFLINPPERILSFPVYQSPAQAVKEQQSEVVENKLSAGILKEIFESPFNTALELREYIEHHHFEWIKSK